jgi:hypothetical protein
VQSNVAFLQYATFNDRNKILVNAVERAKQTGSSGQKTREGMEVWKLLIDQHIQISDDEMDVNE